MKKHENREYVILYQGGSGGFIVSWIMQLAINHKYLTSALKCFPLILKENSRIWKNHEITPPNIGLLCNCFQRNDDSASQKEIELQVDKSFKKLKENNKSINSMTDANVRLKYFFFNYVWKRADFKNKPWDPYDYPHYNGSINHIIELSDIIYDKTRTIIVKAPTQFIKLCEKTKASTKNNKVDFCGAAVKHKAYIGPIIAQYENDLIIFDITTLWNDKWKYEIENIINRELTTKQYNACYQIINRWLYITPQIIKNTFNI